MLLNVDGSDIGNPGQLGVGPVIRDHCGMVFRIFSNQPPVP